MTLDNALFVVLLIGVALLAVLAITVKFSSFLATSIYDEVIK